MFPFDPPENIRKPLILMFSGGSKENNGNKRDYTKLSSFEDHINTSSTCLTTNLGFSPPSSH